MRINRIVARKRLRRIKVIITVVATVIVVSITVAVLTTCGESNASEPETNKTQEPYQTETLTEIPTMESRSQRSIETLETEETEKKTLYTEEDIVYICKTVAGEALICSREEQALVVWTILNRVDAQGVFRHQNTIEDVVLHKGAFDGYHPDNEYPEEIRTLVVEELDKWCEGEEAPTLKPYTTDNTYLYFEGDGRHNWFRTDY